MYEYIYIHNKISTMYPYYQYAMSRQTQADKQKRHWYRPSSIAAWPCRKHPGLLTSHYIIKDTSYGKFMQECRDKTGHYDDNMQIAHIGIIMITLTRNPVTRINLCSKHTEIHFIYAKFVPMTLMSHYPEILRNTRWQNCTLSTPRMIPRKSNGTALNFTRRHKYHHQSNYRTAHIRSLLWDMTRTCKIETQVTERNNPEKNVRARKRKPKTKNDPRLHIEHKNTD